MGEQISMLEQLTANSAVVQTGMSSPATPRVYRHIQAYTVHHSNGAVKSY